MNGPDQLRLDRLDLGDVLVSLALHVVVYPSRVDGSLFRSPLGRDRRLLQYRAVPRDPDPEKRLGPTTTALAALGYFAQLGDRSGWPGVTLD